MPSELRALQSLFWSSVRDGTLDDAAIEAAFTAGTLGAVPRLRIYRGMYWARQFVALGQDFPRVAATVGGTPAFRRLAHAYLLAHPSRDACLERLGQDLPAFLAAHAEPAWSRLADLAWREWAQVAAFIAPDPPALATHWDIPAEQAPAARLELIPSLQLLELASDPDDVSAGADAPIDATAPTATASAPRAPVCLALWRREFHVFSARLEAPELRAARAARRGATIAEICAEIGAELAGVADAELRAASTLGTWLARGWIARLVPGGAT